MALGALDARVTALQRILRRSVLLHGEGRRFPALHFVTGRAFPRIGPLQELAIVSVFVAIGALGEWDLFFEVAISVALGAIDFEVLAFERIFRFGVIEFLADALQRNLLPTGSGVAGGASLRETAVVRILVAVGAEIERDAHVPRLAIRPVRVTLLAFHLRVQSGQRIARLAVIELADVDLFPVDEVVARLAGGTEASFVEIFVARNARRGQSEERAIQILVLDRRALLRRDARSVVALIALKSLVLTFEHVPRFVVVESLGVPLDQGKIFAVVFRVAAGALLTGSCGNVVGGMKAAVSVQAVSDFCVALQALESGLAAELVTTGAVGRSIQRLVGTRERSWRNLGCARRRKKEDAEQEKNQSQEQAYGRRCFRRARSRRQRSILAFFELEAHTPLARSTRTPAKNEAVPGV